MWNRPTSIKILNSVQQEDSNLSVNGSLYVYDRHGHYNAVSSPFRGIFTNQSLTINNSILQTLLNWLFSLKFIISRFLR